MSTDNILKSYKAGDIIMKQGEQGDYAYIIEEGRVEIYIETADGEEQIIGTRGSRSMIGEMALIDSAPRTASIRAIEDCKFLIITQDDFTRRLNNSDPIVRMTTQVILARYRDTLARTLDIKNQYNPAEHLELQSAAADEAIQQVKLYNDLKEGFEKGQLFFVYQPIIDIKKQALAGFESLMRWEHPEKGFISPEVFIPLAEKTGLIDEMTPWLLKSSIDTARNVQEVSGTEISPFVSINISANSFQKQGFIEDAMALLEGTPIRPQQIHMEITERLLMSDPLQAKAVLDTIEAQNFNISIDDFGTGYSSLSYLHDFPIHTLKIDRSFVTDMTRREKSLALIKSIIALGKNMRMKIIAEGVENKDEALKLQELGCDMIQGYYFSKPLSHDDLIAFAKKPIELL